MGIVDRDVTMHHARVESHGRNHLRSAGDAFVPGYDRASARGTTRRTYGDTRERARTRDNGDETARRKRVSGDRGSDP